MLKYPDLQHKYNQTQQMGFCSLASSTSETKARSGGFLFHLIISKYLIKFFVCVFVILGRYSLFLLVKLGNSFMIRVNYRLPLPSWYPVPMLAESSLLQIWLHQVTIEAIFALEFFDI